jgi:hypothetical protein
MGEGAMGRVGKAISARRGFESANAPQTTTGEARRVLEGPRAC